MIKLGERSWKRVMKETGVCLCFVRWYTGTLGTAGDELDGLMSRPAGQLEGSCTTSGCCSGGENVMV